MKLRILVIIALFLVSCHKPAPVDDPAKPEPMTLDVPALLVKGNLVQWAKVPNAATYDVSVDGEITNVGSKAYIDLLGAGEGEHSVAARSKGDGEKYLDSDWSALVQVDVRSESQPLCVPEDFSRIAEHPRILLGKGKESALRQVIEKPGNSHLKTVHDNIVSESEAVFSKDVISRGWNGSMLNVAREALRRIFFLSYMYRFSGQEKYAERAEKEMLSLCRFDDWNPGHFLDTGEAQLALAIGFDWCNAYLAPSSQRTIAKAIIDKGFGACFEPSPKTRYWVTSNNWNPVCIGGSMCAAIAIYELYPEECRKCIMHDMPFLQNGLNWYSPDGTYREGYTYWGYGTAYEVITADAFKTAFGLDLGLEKSAGFIRSSLFRLFTSTPTFGTFAFGDSGTESVCDATQYWFADMLEDPSCVWETKRQVDSGLLSSSGEERFFPAMVVRASRCDFSGSTEPEEHFYEGAGESPVFIYRSGWNSTEDCYLGVKGGCPRSTHGHMDAGMFYYENKGVRWAADPGSQSYGAVQSMLDDDGQNGQKWILFRYGPDGHNILRFGNHNQNVNSMATISECWKKSDKKGCSVDLSATYEGQAGGTRRAVWLDAGDNLNVEDSFTASRDANLYWNLVSKSEARVVSNNEICLESDGHSASLICDAAGAVAYVVSASTGKSYDPANPGMVRAGFIIPVLSGKEYEITTKLTVTK